MHDIVIVGGGPSGLAAAQEAVGHGARVLVAERLDQVGGLARTLEFEGSRFDIGPHRFYTRNREVHDLFVATTGEDLVYVPRLTRIYYRNRYFDYPLTPVNALFGVGVVNSAGIAASYGAARVRSGLGLTRIDNFEDWVTDRFGRKLYRTFFKTYTEKVWGIPCTQIGADWASQRIKGLSLAAAVRNAVFKPKQPTLKTLVNEFVYPRLGAGQVYEKMADGVVAGGSDVVTGLTVRRIRRDGATVTALEAVDGRGAATSLEGRYFLVSAPLTELVAMIDPPPPAEVLEASRRLRFRNHVGVNLLVEGNPFPDNWLYVHAADVTMARIANYRNFSPAMTSGDGVTPLTVEYFTFPGDGVWEASDGAMIERATAELATVGILPREAVRGGFVVRSEKAYPVFEIGFDHNIEIIKRWLDGLDNLLPIGRSGMFKYNNQDHAMMTGLLAARTALGVRRYDPWLVNIDAEYQEDAPAPSELASA
ncbi:MAG: NAD(P)/FAD-dependent oxidoreductase [Rhodospirillaceae bacterium]